MAGTLARIKVLVVDDSHHMVQIVKAILRGLGILDIQQAHSAAQALELIATNPFDLIITDLVMAPMDGCELTRRIRGKDGGANRFVPIIMLSAYSERSRVEAARDAGINEFCAKPVTAAELYRKIAMVANHPRPFVRTSVYAGPSRRRRESPITGPERRDS